MVNLTAIVKSFLLICPQSSHRSPVEREDGRRRMEVWDLDPPALPDPDLR